MFKRKATFALPWIQLQNQNLLRANRSTTTQSDEVEQALDITENVEEKDRIFEAVDVRESQQIICGLQILQQLNLNPSEQLLCVDRYEMLQTFILMCNINDTHEKNRMIDGI